MNFKPAFAVAISTLLFSFPALASEKQQYTPEQVKSVYLYRIANFIRWDNEAEMDHIHFCIDDNEVVKNTFSKLTDGKSIRGLSIETDSSDTQHHCDVVFVSGELSNVTFEKYPDNALTVSDLDGFTDIGGMIQLESVNNRIRPVINITNTKEAPISIGANLMRVSRVEGEQ